MRLSREIPVLLYHHIGNYPAAAMEDGLLPETFTHQMQYLSSQDRHTIVPLSSAVDHLTGRVTLPPGSMSLTIDDGFRNAVTDVLPVLQRHAFHATFFVIPEYIGGHQTVGGISIPCMDWHELDAIAQAGMGIGILACKGRGIRKQYDDAYIRESVISSLEIMNDTCHGPIRYIAFREGVPEPPLWQFLQSRGIEAVFTQCPTNRRASLAGIGRIQIDDDDQNIFLTKISRTYLFFKDMPSWKYIRRYNIDWLAHRLSDMVNRMTGKG